MIQTSFGWIERAAQGGPILIALSGGGDSTALLHLMLEAFGAEHLRVCIVDHALREGSAADAALACERAKTLLVEAEVHKLRWPEGRKANQANARTARYVVLSDAAREQNCRVIALGHNADDQAETIMMRAESGSSWRGLAGMRALAPAPIWPEGRGLWLARPLLDQRREALRVFLKERDAPWIEDPANANPNFARVRMRARLAEMERDGFDPMRLCEEAKTHQMRAAALDADARALIASAAALAKGEARLDRAVWLDAASEVQARALSVLFAAVSGSEREAPVDQVERLAGEMASPDFRGAALGGAVVSPLSAAFAITRDRGAVLGRAGGAKPLPALILPEGRPVIWDNRLELIAARPGWQIVPGPGGSPILERAHAVQTLEEAEAAGEICAHWLTEAHIVQLLPPEGVAFTGS